MPSEGQLARPGKRVRPSGTVGMYVQVPPELRQALKVRATEAEATLSAYVAGVLASFVEQEVCWVRRRG